MAKKTKLDETTQLKREVRHVLKKCAVTAARKARGK